MSRIPIGILLILALPAAPARGASREIERSIEKGLNYLVKTQSRRGNWWANNSAYPVAMTALAGLALACEGSTPNDGRYSQSIALAIDYLLSQTQPNGLIGIPRINDRYNYGHGFSMLFLSQVYGEEEDPERRALIKRALTKGAEFCGKSQTNDGGWGYVSAKDGRGFDEGSVTITQIQGLRGTKISGVVVKKEIIDKAISYMEKCVTSDGGVKYRLAQGGGGGQPAITAAGIAVLIMAGQYESKLLPKMFKFCEQKIPLSISARGGHTFYTHLYYSQACYFKSEEKWNGYISKIGPELAKAQLANGSWSKSYVGDVFSTSIALIILQLENNILPVFQR